MNIIILSVLFLLDGSSTTIVDLSDKGIFGDRPFAISESGGVLVLDSHAGRVLYFDKNGKYVKDFGTRGQGPGEWQRPITVEWNRAEKVFIIVDQRNARFSKWTESGELIKEVKRPNGIYHVEFIDGDRFLGAWDAAGRMGRPAVKLARLTDISDAKTLWGLKLDAPPEVHRLDIGGQRFMFAPTWSERLIFSRGSDFAAVTFGRSGLVSLVDFEGTPLVHDLKPRLVEQPMSTKQYNAIVDEQPIHRRETIRKMVPKPETWPLIRGLRVDDHDRIWIFGAPGEENGLHSYVVYDRKGQVLHTGDLEAVPHLIQDGFLYYITDTNETESRVVKAAIPFDSPNPFIRAW